MADSCEPHEGRTLCHVRVKQRRSRFIRSGEHQASARDVRVDLSGQSDRVLKEAQVSQSPTCLLLSARETYDLTAYERGLV